MVPATARPDGLDPLSLRTRPSRASLRAMLGGEDMFLKALGAVSLVAALVTACDAERQTPVSYPATPADTRMSTAMLSKQLQQGMTEAQVTEMREPDSITMETCGQNSRAGSWQCKIYHYGSFLVMFNNGRGSWTVNSWF